MTDLGAATPGDFLVCGACHMNFKLSGMQDFIQHKLFDCQGIPQKAMECQSCPTKFQTPWSLLQHAQNTHSLKIFLQEGPYSPGIAGIHIDKSTEKSDGISRPITSSHIDAMQESIKAPTDTELSDRSSGKPVVAVRSASGPKPAPDLKTSCKCAVLAPSTGTSNATTTSMAKCSLPGACILTRNLLGTQPGQVKASPGHTKMPPTQVKSPSMQITEPPGQVTATPVQVTKVTAPVTAPPVPFTATPGQVTAPSVQVTEITVPPVQVTVPPVQVTAPPVQVTAASVQVTAPSVQVTKTTVPPVQVTAAPVQVTAAPVQVTAAPVQVTAAPVQVTVPPVQVTVPPVTGPPVQAGSKVVKEAVPPTSSTTDVLLHNLPNLVQRLDKEHAILTAPGKHSISVLQPIRLPKGTIIGTAVAIGNPALTRKPFTTVPISVPTQVKTLFTVPKEINTTQAAIYVNEDKNLNPQGPIAAVVASCVMTAPVISKLAESHSVNTKDNTKGLDKSHHQPKPVAHTLTLQTPATTSNSALVLQKTQTLGIVPSPKSIQTNSTNKVDSSSVNTPIQEPEDVPPKQPKNCVCFCCKAGKCCVGGEPVTSNIEKSEVQQSRSHCCDASVQADDSDKTSDDAIGCCDNQDCGVTIMPGTHEGLKKCCNAVVPKKRKRHMETKHRVKKRAVAPSFSMPEENTIYIEFQPGSDIPRVSSATGVTLNGADPLGTITVNTSSANSQQMMQTIDNQRSLTLSFPVSYTRKTSCSAGSCGRMGQECTCGCTPLKFQSNRDKKSKSTRRLSSSSNDSKKEPTTGRATAGSAATEGTDTDLAVGVKDEGVTSMVDSSEEASQSSISGTRKISRPLSRAGVGKKRRYPTSRPFKCDKCDHAFNQRIHLKKHQSKHTGVKPFKCEQCDYSTVERSHLKVHIRVHTGEKPYKCSHCEYATAQNSTLKIHLKRHHGQGGEDGGGGSLSCDVCGREFDDEGPFLQHQQEHPPQASSSVSGSGGPSSAEQISMAEPEAAMQVHSGEEESLPDGRLIVKEM